MTCMPPEWECLRAASPRLELQDDLICFYLRCRSANLAQVQSNFRLLMVPINAASASNAAFGKQSAAVLPSLAPHDSKARLQDVTNRRRFMAKPCTPHLIPQAAQLFELLACNGGVKGQGPLRSLGGPRGIFSHVREYPPFPVQRLRRCFPPPRNARKNIKKSTLTGALFQIAEN